MTNLFSEDTTGPEVMEGDAARAFLQSIGFPTPPEGTEVKVRIHDGFDSLPPELLDNMSLGEVYSTTQQAGLASEASSATTPVEELPGGINPKDLLGMKKPNLALVPPSAVLHEAAAMMDGAAKYGPYNWRENKVLMMVYLAAAQRHIAQLLDGEDFDPTSGVHHAGHARACLGIILDAYETGNLADDRPLPGAAGQMIRSWDEDTKFQL